MLYCMHVTVICKAKIEKIIYICNRRTRVDGSGRLSVLTLKLMRPRLHSYKCAFIEYETVNFCVFDLNLPWLRPTDR